MIKLEDVSKTYRVGTFGGQELRAVCDVNFTIENGQMASLIGESGSGKSTIGKMILGLTPITSGSIIFNGEDISEFDRKEMKEYNRYVQGVFQDPFCSYNPIFKADRIFRIIREEYYPEVDKAEWKTKVEKALESVGLNPVHVLHKFPHQLSGGQLQRFLIARALLLDLRFLVADEIISMLDASTRIDVLNLLAELKASSGLSILFITHDLSLANYIGEQALILYRGYVVEKGDTHEIFEHSLHPYTRMLMAAVPRIDRKWEEVQIGLRKKQLPVGEGCVYYGRCPIGAEECTQQVPPLEEVKPNHHVACFRYEEYE